MPTVMRQGHRLDTSTARRLAWAEDVLGFPLVVVQGSYNPGKVGKSAGTHDLGGVVDIRTWNLDEVQRSRALTVLREAGLIAWYRTKAQGFDPHIHAIELASTTLSPSAAKQRDAWRRGRNGLARDGRDDGPKVDIPTAMPDETSQSEEDDMSQYEEVLGRIETEAATAARRVNDGNAVLTKLAQDVSAFIYAETKRDETDERRTLTIMKVLQNNEAAIRKLAEQGLSSDGNARAALEQIKAIVAAAS